METLIAVVKKELKSAFRERLVVALGLIVMLLLSASMYSGYVAYTQQQANIENLQKEKRKQWLEQHEKHPHIAAHYGTYVFKPKSILSIFDFGLDSYTGTSIYLEAHYQHEFMFRPAQLRSSMVRFGELSIAMVLKVFLPLLIIFVAFSAYTKERESGTLRLLLSQGVSLGILSWGKIIAISLLVGLTLIPFFVGFTVSWFLDIDNTVIPDISTRLILLIVLYITYLFVLIVLSVWVSLQCKNGKSALLTLLVCWIAATILLPKATANLSESIYPLPSMRAFKAGIQTHKDNGLDGKTSKVQRYEQLKKEMLQKHDVDSIQKLPFNFSGYSMQASEEYSDKIYDFHTKKLRNQLLDQNFISRFTSLINPYQATQNLSMAIAATDIHSTFHFEDEVNKYRRKLIKTMNDDMAYNTKYGEFYEYKVGKDLFEKVPDFRHQTQMVYQVLKQYIIEIISIILWVSFSLLLLNRAHRKANSHYV
ncbi:DUF3526 domain-containing protein [Pseudofulvibacter geojedonensis]|uniref:DUF3526 domain-containing protein n=1 Tax=Pseudofulvibacter geojedonensis TaxID=1123758 RepID=A0ABW3I363_9FLAO